VGLGPAAQVSKGSQIFHVFALGNDDAIGAMANMGMAPGQNCSLD
jgi:hypothetical protein